MGVRSPTYRERGLVPIDVRSESDSKSCLSLFATAFFEVLYRRRRMYFQFRKDHQNSAEAMALSCKKRAAFSQKKAEVDGKNLLKKEKPNLRSAAASRSRSSLPERRST